MSKTYLCADLHFGHASMLKFCPDTRPYPDVTSMNEAMASAWSKRVKRDDDVIVVGDFSHRMEQKALRKLFDSLPGRKHLIIGNHDVADGSLDLPWTTKHYLCCTTIDSQRVVLCHYPMLSWPGSSKGNGALMLYGHHHGRIRGNQQSCDIGVDVMGPAPVRLNEIKAYMAMLPARVDPEGDDELDVDGVQP